MTETGPGEASTGGHQRRPDGQLLLLLLATVAAPAADLTVSGDWYRAGTLRQVTVDRDGVLALERGNLLENPSFEWDQDRRSRAHQDGLATPWNLWGEANVYGPGRARSVPTLDPAAVDATRSQRIDLQASGRTPLHLNQNVTSGFTPGQPVTFSASVKVSDPRALGVTVTLMFGRAGQWIGLVSSPQPATSPDFERLRVSAPCPAEADLIRCTILVTPRVDDARGTLWADAAQLEVGPDATAFTPSIRHPDGEVIAAPVDTAALAGPYRLSWTASEPAGARVAFQLRGAATREALEQASWLGPEGADEFATRRPVGPNLLTNPSLEDLGDGGVPREANPQGYGDNDRTGVPTTEARTGRSALMTTITRYGAGDGRWQVGCDGPFEPGGLYAFTVHHLEDRTTAPVALAVSLRLAGGTMRWAFARQPAPSSTTWRREVLFFRMPREAVERVFLEVSLAGVGTVVSDDFSLQRAVEGCEAPLRAEHRTARWLQLRSRLTTADRSVGPRLYQLRLAGGPPQPAVRWCNVLRDDGVSQCYRFAPGETAVFRPEVVYDGAPGDVRAVRITLTPPSGAALAPLELRCDGAPSGADSVWSGHWTVPADAPEGLWRAVCVVETATGTCREPQALRVRQPYREAPRQMRLSAIVTDYGFNRYEGAGLEQVIAAYRSARGLDEWLVSVSWARLEPLPGRLNPAMVAGLRKVLAAARESGVTVRLAIMQQNFPVWANDGDEDSVARYQYHGTARLADTWARLAAAVGDLPALGAVQVINEENGVPDADTYLRAMSKVQAALCEALPRAETQVVVRPASADPFQRTGLGLGGAFDYDYGTGGYPTHWSWYYRHYAHPISQTACLRMARLRTAPAVYGLPGGVGEIGFYRREGADAFGDEDKLRGFQRAMTIAYELGQSAFTLWAGEFAFADWATYTPKLAAFRDELLRRPRPSRFDVRLVLDTGDPLYQETPNQSALDFTRQPTATVVRYLDEHGYVWFYATPEALALQTVGAAATVRFSELKGRPATAQTALLDRLLRGVTPSGTKLPWPPNPE